MLLKTIKKPISQRFNAIKQQPLIVKATESSMPVEDPNIYLNALKIRGLVINGQPRDPKLYRLTNEALDNVYTGQPIKLHLNFKQGGFDCGSDKNSAGCYHWDEPKNLDIRDDMTDQLYKFALLHEYAHSSGIKDEIEADKFAQKYVPVDGWYNKIRKPLQGKLYNTY